MEAITITQIVAANRLFNTEKESYVHCHRRARWAVVLKRTGRTVYQCEGKQYVSDNQHPVILPKGCAYSWRCEEAGECLLIEFDAPVERKGLYSFSVSDSRFVESAFWEIRNHLHEPQAAAQFTCHQRLYGVLAQLAKREEYTPMGKRKLLQPAVEYIARHYFDTTITNDQLSQLCGISTVYFRKCFEAVYGRSPIRYLHDYRIDRAKEILSSDYESIGQVAASVGYSSVYHFSKMFKQYTGTSPTQYAKQT